MKKMLDFLKRLENESLNYTIEKCPSGLSMRVNVFVEPEIWVIDFFTEGDVLEIEAEIYEYRKTVSSEHLENLFGRLQKAWKEAAIDLEIDLITPYTFEDSCGKEYSCAGLLQYFGNENGTILLARNEVDTVYDAADEMGFYIAGINPRYYEKYDRIRFIDTLRDWGWFGDERKKPTWFNEV